MPGREIFLRATMVISKEIIPSEADKTQAQAALLLYNELLFKVIIRYSVSLLTLIDY